MKTTRSIDGVDRVTVRVEHRLSRDDLVEIFAFAFVLNRLIPSSHAAAMKLVREILANGGVTDFWQEEFSSPKYLAFCQDEAEKVVANVLGWPPDSLS